MQRCFSTWDAVSSCRFVTEFACLKFQTKSTSLCRIIAIYVGWRGGATGKAFGLAINRSRVQILLEVTLRKNLGQVVYTYVPLSPSSITWYRPKGGDALRLGR